MGAPTAPVLPRLTGTDERSIQRWAENLGAALGKELGQLRVTAGQIGDGRHVTLTDTLLTTTVPIALPGAPTDPLHAATKGYVDAGDAALTTALDGKSNTGHGHTQGDITGLTDALAAKADATATTTALDGKYDKTGGTVTGNVLVNTTAPGLQLYYPAVKHWWLHCNAAGTLIFADGDSSTVHAYLTSAGQLVHRAPSATTTGYSIICDDGRINNFKWVDGGAYLELTVDSSAFAITATPSDERRKDDIAPTTEAMLPLIRRVAFVDYRYKPLPGVKRETPMPRKVAGVSAQQIRPIKDDWVIELSDGSLALDPAQLVTSTMKAVQELDATVQAQAAAIAELQRQVAQLSRTPTTPPGPGATPP